MTIIHYFAIVRPGPLRETVENPTNHSRRHDRLYSDIINGFRTALRAARKVGSSAVSVDDNNAGIATRIVCSWSVSNN